MQLQSSASLTGIGWSRRVSFAHLKCGAVNMQVQEVSARTTHFYFMWPLFLQKARLVPSLVSRARAEITRPLGVQTSELTHHFCYIVLFKTKSQGQPRFKEWEKRQSFLMGREAKIIGVCIERWEKLSWSSLQITSYMLFSVFFILLSLHASV